MENTVRAPFYCISLSILTTLFCLFWPGQARSADAPKKTQKKAAISAPKVTQTDSAKILENSILQFHFEELNPAAKNSPQKSDTGKIKTKIQTLFPKLKNSDLLKLENGSGSRGGGNVVKLANGSYRLIDLLTEQELRTISQVSLQDFNFVQECSSDSIHAFVMSAEDQNNLRLKIQDAEQASPVLGEVLKKNISRWLLKSYSIRFFSVDFLERFSDSPSVSEKQQLPVALLNASMGLIVEPIFSSLPAQDRMALFIHEGLRQSVFNLGRSIAPNIKNLEIATAAIMQGDYAKAEGMLHIPLVQSLSLELQRQTHRNRALAPDLVFQKNLIELLKTDSFGEYLLKFQSVDKEFRTALLSYLKSFLEIRSPDLEIPKDQVVDLLEKSFLLESLNAFDVLGGLGLSMTKDMKSLCEMIGTQHE